MNSSKTQVNKKLKSLNKRINNLNKRLINNAPVAISSKNGSTGKDYYRTQGRERISNVTALNQNFNVVDVFINPANSSLFPWLSGIGKKYDLYHFKRLRFSYVPALPTSEEGNVYIGLDYNTLDPNPSSSTELCQLSHWTMNVVWKPTSISVDLNNIGWLYTRQGSVPNADYKTYDLGKIFFATEGISFTGIVGYVEVDYDVEFKRRQPDYVSQVTPTTDIYPPMASILTRTISSSSYSTGFETSSYSNSSIIELNNSSGYFQVTKSVIALLFGFYGGSNSSLSTGNLLYESTDNSSYTAVSASTNGNSVILEPGKYYKFYNNNSSTSYFFKISLIVMDDY